MTATTTEIAYPGADATPAEWDVYFAAQNARWKVEHERKKAEHAKRWTYKGLDAWMQGRNHESRKIARNTYLKRRPNGIAVKFHATDVVTYHPDGSITLNSDGWKTMTTKERIDSFTPAWLRVASDRGVWIVLVRDRKSTLYWDGTRYRFFDGITFGPRGGCRNPMPLSAEQRQDDHNKAVDAKISKYVAGWIGKAVDGDMPLPSGGDCWYCSMFPETKGGEADHLLSHIEEGYHVPSLIVKALTAKGYNNVGVAVQFICGLQVVEGRETFETSRIDVKMVRRVLTWYMRKHLRENMAPPRG